MSKLRVPLGVLFTLIAFLLYVLLWVKQFHAYIGQWGFLGYAVYVTIYTLLGVIGLSLCKVK